MNREEIKNRIDLNNIQERRITNLINDQEIKDYLVDFEGNFILPVSLLEMKLIEKIKELEARIIELEKT